MHPIDDIFLKLDAMNADAIEQSLVFLREHGVSESAVATRLGISRSYLGKIKNNERPLTVPIALSVYSLITDVALNAGTRTYLSATKLKRLADAWHDVATAWSRTAYTTGANIADLLSESLRQLAKGEDMSEAEREKLRHALVLRFRNNAQVARDVL
jgi:transcriptional regulator with XRE-family HTH domain